MDRYGSGYPYITGSGGIRIVRWVSTRAADGRGYVTCIVPFPALPLVPSQCEYLFSASFPPPPAAKLRLGIYTNSRVFADLI